MNPPVVPLARISVFFDGQYSVPRLHHPEGVAIGQDGAVWCGNAEGDILRIAPDRRAIDCFGSTGGFTLGLAFDGPDRLFACDQRAAAVFLLDIKSGTLARFTGAGIRIPNYPVVDRARGCLYVSDSFSPDTAGPGVWRYDLTTGKGELWWPEPMAFANGMALSLDGNALFVVETFARRISRIAIGTDGRPAGRTDAAVDLPGLPDGIAVDDRGALYVSCYEPSRILRVDRAGLVSIYAEDPSAHLLCHPTNIAFDGATLYAANLGRWHITRLDSDTYGARLIDRAAAIEEAGP